MWIIAPPLSGVRYHQTVDNGITSESVIRSRSGVVLNLLFVSCLGFYFGAPGPEISIFQFLSVRGMGLECARLRPARVEDLGFAEGAQ